MIFGLKLLAFELNFEMQDLSEALEDMSLDELRILAKKLGLSGYSGLRKAELVKQIGASDARALQKQRFPTWWQEQEGDALSTRSILWAD